MGKLINGIHHVALKCKGVEEFQKTIHFYKDILGLDVARTWGSGNRCRYHAGYRLWYSGIFASAEEDLPQGAIRHFALATDDVDACIAAVREAGYKVTVEPKSMAIQSEPEFPIRIAFCIGPVGEEIEFFHVR